LYQITKLPVIYINNFFLLKKKKQTNKLRKIYFGGRPP
jgi:hypothetical protein